MSLVGLGCFFSGLGCEDELELFRAVPGQADGGGATGLGGETGAGASSPGGAVALGGSAGVGDSGPAAELMFELRISIDGRSADQTLRLRELQYHYGTATTLPTTSWVGDPSIVTTSNAPASVPDLVHDLDPTTTWDAPAAVDPAWLQTAFSLPLPVPSAITLDLLGPDTAHPTDFHIDLNDGTGWWEVLRVTGIEIWDDPSDSSAREADIRRFALEPIANWVAAE